MFHAIAGAGLALLLLATPAAAQTNGYDDGEPGSGYQAPDGIATWPRGYGDNERQYEYEPDQPAPAPTPYTTGGRCLYDRSCWGPNSAFPR